MPDLDKWFGDQDRSFHKKILISWDIKDAYYMYIVWWYVKICHELPWWKEIMRNGLGLFKHINISITIIFSGKRKFIGQYIFEEEKEGEVSVLLPDVTIGSNFNQLIWPWRRIRSLCSSCHWLAPVALLLFDWPGGKNCAILKTMVFASPGLLGPLCQLWWGGHASKPARLKEPLWTAFLPQFW